MKSTKKILSYAIMTLLAFNTLSCSSKNEPDPEPTLSEQYAGNYDGTITLNIAGQYTYCSEISCTLTSGEDDTLTVSFPVYSLTGTMMGDITLGNVRIEGLVYDASKDCFYRDFGGEGITQTMNGTTYPLNDPTSISVSKDSAGKLTIDYPFTLGKMPLPLTATFISK